MGQICTAAILRAPGQEFELQTVELDTPRDDEVLVKIEACGVCGTDNMAQYMLPLPAVLGHEGAGVVLKTGSKVSDVKPGDRVIISWPSCGRCSSCNESHSWACDRVNELMFGGMRLDGSQPVKLSGKGISSAFFQQSAFATHAIAPARSLVVAPPDMPPHLLAPLGCGLMTGAGVIHNSLQVRATDSLLIIGVGAVGLSAAMVARLIGANPIIAVDVDDDRLALALELGATHVLNAKNEEDIPGRVKEIVPCGVRFAFDNTGMDKSWTLAARSLSMQGTLGTVHAPGEEILHFPAFEMVARAAQFKFILAGSSIPRNFLPQMITWYRQGRFPYDRLVTTFDFADINVAFAASKAGKAIKPVLLMS